MKSFILKKILLLIIIFIPNLVLGQTITITGQTTFNEIDEDTNFNIKASDIEYTSNIIIPVKLRLEILPGENYSFKENTIRPKLNYNGPLKIRVRLRSGNTVSNIYNYKLGVKAVNDPPVITSQNGQITGVEDNSFNASFNFINVTDVDNPHSDLSIVVLPGENYTFNGIHIYPNANFNGNLEVNVQVNDGEPENNLSNEFTVNITIASVNDAPVISPIPTQTAEEGNSFTLDLDSYTTDVEGSPITWTYQPPTNYSVSISNGIATVTPNNINWNGSEDIIFTASDGSLSTSTTVTFTLTEVNDAPVITPIPSQTIAEGGTFSNINLNNYVSDVDGDIITWSSNNPTNLNIVINNGIASITPIDINWNGTETVTFIANDGTVNVSTNVNFTVTPVNDPPVINPIPDQIAAEGSNFNNLNLNSYINDPDGDEINWTISTPINFTINITSGIASISTKDDIWNGTEAITFTASDGQETASTVVNFIVTPVNDPPIISGISAQTIDEGESFTSINLNNHVTDEEGDNIQWSVSSTTNIAISLVSNVANISIPDENWNGSENVIFTASDGNSSSSVTVLFTVNPVNDPPVINSYNGTSTILEDTPLSFSISDFDITDIDTDASNFVLNILAGENYSVADNIITPAHDYNGVININAQVSDSETTNNISNILTFPITVNNVNDAPVITDQSPISTKENMPVTIDISTIVDDVDNNINYNSLSLTSNPNHGTAVLNINNHSITYTPTESYFGDDSFGFSICDTENLCVNGTINISISNNAPNAMDDNAQTNEDKPVLIDVLENDTDPQNDIIESSLKIIQPPKHGIASLSSNMILYTPNDNYFGNDDFQYEISDGANYHDIATVNINVISINDAPVFIKQNVLEIQEDNSITLQLSDIELSDDEGSDPTSYVLIVEDGENYTHSGNTITPSPNFSGTLNVNAHVNEGTLVSNSFNIIVTVLPVNDLPVITGQKNIAIPNNVLSVINLTDIIVNDVDNNYPEGFNLSILPGNGYTVNNNSISSDVMGNITVPITVTDPNNGTSDVYNITIKVVHNNNPPQLTPFPDYSVQEGETFNNIELSLFVNDDKTNSSDIQWTTSGNDKINVTINNNNIAIITIEDPEWNGNTKVTFTASDGELSSSMDASFTVTPINDIPIITGQSIINMEEDTPFSIPLSNIIVQDPDNTYPDQHTLIVLSGDNYTVNNNKITPLTNFTGQLKVNIIIKDLEGQSALYPLSVNIIPINDPPVIIGVKQEISIDEDQSYTLKISDLLINDVDNNINELTLLTSSGENYSVVDNTITPNNNFFGTLTVPVRVKDSSSENNISEIYNVEIEVKSVNDAPIGQDINASTHKNTKVIINVVQYINDIDNNLNLQSLNILETSTHGEATENYDGTISYTPETNYNGVDYITYSICDQGDLCCSGKITIIVSNNCPISNDDEVSLDEDNETTVNVLQNDTDLQNDIVVSSLNIVAGPSNGNATVLNNGLIQYLPDNNFFGQDQLIYQICDQLGFCSTANVVFNVAPINDRPRITGSRTLSSNEDEPITILLSDLSVEDIDNTFPNDFKIIVNPGQNYMISGNTVVPTKDYNGRIFVNVSVSDNQSENNISSIYQLPVDIKSVNDAPVITGQTTLTFNEDESFDILLSNLIVNDSDNIYPNDFKIVILPGDNYSIIDNKIVPKPNFNGELNIDVYVDDQQNENNRSAIYTVKVTINSINDAPVATNSNISTSQNQEIEMNINDLVSDSDSEIDYTSLKLILKPLNGKIIYDASQKTITYMPNINFVGNDVFYYSIKDIEGVESNTANVNISISNESPSCKNDAITLDEDNTKSINVLLNDTDPQNNIDSSTLVIVNNPTNGKAIIKNGLIFYTPNLNFFGSDKFIYRVCDTDGHCDQAIVNITVEPINDAPVAKADEVSVQEDESVSIDVLNNDSDIDNEPEELVISVSKKPEHGNVTLDIKTNKFIYKPDLNYNGTDVFKYMLCDAGNLCSENEVNITVNPVNDFPVAIKDNATVHQKESVTIDVLSNDTDIDNNLDNNTLTITKDAKHGKTTISNSRIIYTADDNFVGEDTIRYQICDTKGACASAIVIVEITNTNNPPILNDDAVEMEAGSTKVIDVLINDIDPDVNDKILIKISDKGNCTGKISVNNDNTITYKSLTTSACSTEWFIYKGCNPDGKCSSAKVTINLTSIVCKEKNKITTSFSPNGDKVNDVFIIPNLKELGEVDLMVYNSWGQEVYKKSNYDNSWAGLGNCSGVKNKELEEGTYYYILIIKKSKSVIKGYIYIKK